jgi:hypothetical protein
MNSIHILPAATLHFLEYEIRHSLKGIDRLDWDDQWKSEQTSWAYQLIQLMMLMAQGKVKRLSPVWIEVEDEDYMTEEGLTYWFDVVTIGQLITNLDLADLVRKTPWPDGWKIDPSWNKRGLVLAEKNFQDYPGIQFWDIIFGKEAAPIGHVVIHDDYVTVLDTEKKRIHYQRGPVNVGEVIEKYFSHLDCRFCRYVISDELYLLVSLEMLFEISDESWVYN